MKRPALTHFLLTAAAGLAVTAAASAVETFDDAETSLELEFNDFPDAATGTGPARGTPPGLTVRDGTLVFYDNSNFGDVAAASLVPDRLGDARSFRVAVNVAVDQFDFTQGKVGVFALAQGPTGFDEGYTGLYAYVQETDTSGDRYRFVLTLNNDGVGKELAESGVFDLTDGTPDFSLEVVGSYADDGNLKVVAKLLQDGREAVAPLEADVAEADLPNGERFGVRINPGFNTLELAMDNLAIETNPDAQP